MNATATSGAAKREVSAFNHLLTRTSIPIRALPFAPNSLCCSRCERSGAVRVTDVTKNTISSLSRSAKVITKQKQKLEWEDKKKKKKGKILKMNKKRVYSIKNAVFILCCILRK